LQAERLATIGKMSAKVAHEVRNPLSSISLNLELLEDELAMLLIERRGEMNRLLGAVRSQVDVLSGVTEEYLHFARLPKPKRETVSLQPLIANLTDFVREEMLGRKVELLVDVQDDLPALHVDPGQIRQALLNLIRNAAEAMPNGGTIRLEARALAPDSTGTEARRSRGAEKEKSGSALVDSPQRPSAPAPLPFIEVTVADTGVGIPADNLERVFEPFFTSKEGGTGLGLAISRQIAIDHGGTLTCESVPGGGTTFRLQLPVAEGEHAQ
jgi:two-component system NtrC family sensor kinase